MRMAVTSLGDPKRSLLQALREKLVCVLRSLKANSLVERLLGATAMFLLIDQHVSGVFYDPNVSV